MELILVRHAEAEPADGYAEDALRPLTKKGSKAQEKVAMALRKLGCRPDRVFTSPRLRAVQTAQITSDILGVPDPQELPALDGGYDLDALLAGIGQCADDETVMCVGHEPDMSLWSGRLLAGNDGMGVRFKKSAVLGMRFAATPAAGTAELSFFYRPKDLQTLL